MQITRRMVLTTAAALAATPALVACGTGSEPKTPGAGAPLNASTAGTLSYLNFFGPADPQNILYPYALKAFQAKFPKANVEQTTTAGGTGNVMEKFLALSAAGTTPDVAALNPQFVEPLRARNALADMTDFVKRDGKSFQPEDFNEATLLRAVRNGRWTAIPLQMGLWFLFYNATLLQQAGLGRPTSSWTWDQVLEAARTVRGRDMNALGMTTPPYELPVRDNGGDVLSPDEKKCILDETAAVDAIQWNGDLQQKHRVVPGKEETGGQDARALFDAGRYVFHIGDPGFLSSTVRNKLSFQWDIATIK